MRTWVALALVGAVALTVRGTRRARALAEPPPAYELAPLPPGIDSLTALPVAVSRILECSSDCSGVVYFWSPRMPLSRVGIANIAEAAENVGARLTVVAFDELYDYARRGVRSPAGSQPLLVAMLDGGALAHAPALVVHRGGRVLGPAILGYKSASAYQALISRRLSAKGTRGGGRPSRFPEEATSTVLDARRVTDYEVVGIPGAYFRWVPGRQALAYESRRRIFLLDLVDRESRVAPGFVDFIPTPDGRYFVTPSPRDGGLTFYDADEVFEAARQRRSGTVQPIFTDLQMRDQYPSVGILEADGSRTLYRVLTSWFAGIVYRDYDVRVDPATGVSSVRPVGQPVVPCRESSLSTPIMSQDGLRVAARDEATGTTKIFQILPGGGCEEIVDLGVATSKVAWHPEGRKLAFARPRRRGGASPGEEGIFVFDLEQRRLVSVPSSEAASSLAFPEFLGDDAVVFLVPGTSPSEASVFRVIEGID